MHCERVLRADAAAQLAHRLQEWQTLDIADRATHFDDDDVRIAFAQPQNSPLDFVGDVRDDLNGAPK